MNVMLQTKIENQIQNNKIVVYMKGTPDFPQCGFSHAVVQVLKASGYPFAAHNVLDDPELRQGIKEFSNWPTIPQVYVQGEFIGGCDIVMEMHQRGELQPLLDRAFA
jgi:monothiol glutaredoxin